jgi:hypothetical protein
MMPKTLIYWREDVRFKLRTVYAEKLLARHIQCFHETLFEQPEKDKKAAKLKINKYFNNKSSPFKDLVLR